ncbi:hypothetical protein [Bermanella sp. R86510]|uniref:hypothetical protein n=1 Tax=unclassified Bermanella TaxID=2627862 RepID=UPI0037C82E30
MQKNRTISFAWVVACAHGGRYAKCCGSNFIGITRRVLPLAGAFAEIIDCSTDDSFYQQGRGNPALADITASKPAVLQNSLRIFNCLLRSN